MANNVKIDLRDFQKLMSELDDLPDHLLDKAEPEMVRQTPVRSGNARRNTKRSGDAIRANYAYAGRLDDGYSRQAPDGFTEPTIKHIEREFNKYIGRID